MTLEERKDFLDKIADSVKNWEFARLFADCIDKTYFEPNKAGHTAGAEAFDQLISRFNTYLKNISQNSSNAYGIIVHDNNPGIADERMQMMRNFIDKGTRYLENVDHVIETPLFVDSKLTSMVQIADLCAYALRRYIENDERDLFDKIFHRADRFKQKLVGVRHFTKKKSCNCDLCSN